MNHLSIAIITPSYNQGEFIEATINSVLTQNIENLDYLVVDGASTDSTVAILNQYRDKLRFISEPDHGQTDAVNKGIKMTHSDIIGWLNSDDIYYPQALQKVIDFFTQNPEVDFLYGNGSHIDRTGNFLEPYPNKSWDPQWLHEQCFICQPAVFFRRSVIDRCGLLNEDLHYCMDYEYWLRIAQRKDIKVAYLPEVLAGSRLYPETKTMGSRFQVAKEINRMQKNILGKVADTWLIHYAHVYTEQRINRQKHPKLFVALVALLVLWEPLRWNHKISFNLMKLAAGWIKNTFRFNPKKLLFKNSTKS